MVSINSDLWRGDRITEWRQRKGSVLSNADGLGNDVPAVATRVLARRPRAVIAFWFIALLVSAYWATQLINDTVFAFTPPPYSYAVSRYLMSGASFCHRVSMQPVNTKSALNCASCSHEL